MCDVGHVRGARYCEWERELRRPLHGSCVLGMLMQEVCLSLCGTPLIRCVIGVPCTRSFAAAPRLFAASRDREAGASRRSIGGIACDADARRAFAAGRAAVSADIAAAVRGAKDAKALLAVRRAAASVAEVRRFSVHARAWLAGAANYRVCRAAQRCW